MINKYLALSLYDELHLKLSVLLILFAGETENSTQVRRWSVCRTEAFQT